MVVCGVLDFFKEIYKSSQFSHEEEQELLIDLLSEKEVRTNAIIGLYAVCDKENQNESFEHIFEHLKNEEYINKYFSSLIKDESENFDIKEKIKYFDQELIERLWDVSNEDIKFEKFTEIIANVDDNSFLQKFWPNTPEEFQARYFRKIVDDYKKRVIEDESFNPTEFIISIWKNTKESIQIENQDIFFELIEKLIENNLFYDSSSNVGEVWKKSPEEFQARNFRKIVDDYKKREIKDESFNPTEFILSESFNPTEFIISIWENTKESIQIENQDIFWELIENLTENNSLYYSSSKVGEVWEKSTEEFQARNFRKIVDDYKKREIEDESFNSTEFIISIWKNTKESIQIENQDIFLDLIEKLIENNSRYELKKIWEDTLPQEQLWDSVFEKTKNNYVYVDAMWSGTQSDLQIKKWDKVVELSNVGVPQFVWQGASAEVQEMKWEELVSQFESETSLLILYKLSKPEVQDSHSEIVTNLMKGIRDNQKEIEETWWNIDVNVQKQKWDEVYEIMNENKESLVSFWKSTKWALQEEKIGFLFEKYKNDWKNLSNLWSATDYSIQKEKWDEFLELTNDDISKQVDMWAKTDKFIIQHDKEQFFVELLEKAKDNPECMCRAWYNTRDDLQEKHSEMLKQVIKSMKGVPCSELCKLWNNTSEQLLTEDILNELISKMYPELNKNQIKDMVYEYQNLKQINTQLDKTINLQILNPQIRKIFSKEQLIRVTTDCEIQDKIVKFGTNPQFLKVINYVVENSENWTIELNDLCTKFDEYEELLNNISENKLLDENMPKLIGCLSGSKNYFNVKNIEDIEEFFDKRKLICHKVLQGQDVSDYMSDDFNHLDKDEKKSFAMLELAYGIDINEAKNLVNKYGTDIEKIETKTSNEEILKKTVTALKLLLNSNSAEIEYIYEQNKDVILNWQELEYSNIATLEADALNLYGRLFDESCKWTETSLDSVDYEGKEVDVSEITSDFKTFVRVEGAYSDWKEPEDFQEYIKNVEPTNNGNCKSFVGNNLFARARPKGPTFGYYKCLKNSLNLVAPWDIVSDSANRSFSPGSVKWDFKTGIQFRTPDDLLDNVRHNHNEIVTNKWHFNEDTQKIEREMPDFVLYVQPNSEYDISQDDSWRMTVKAAAQLDIPIKVINLEKMLEKETMKIDNFEQIFLGKKENTTDLSEEQILERLIVEFENNRVTTRFSGEKNQEKFFTDNKRTQMFENIQNRIESFKETDNEKYRKLLRKMKNILEQEVNKSISVNGSTVYGGPDLDLLREKLEIYNTKVKQNVSDLELSNQDIRETLNCINEIAKSSYYDNNKQHSIEHVGKVILFSKILAKNENLNDENTNLLLAAAAFHDSGRQGEDGNKKHAEASSQQIKKYLEENPNNSFGITESNIGILQTAIHYHEHYEEIKGKLDIDKIKELAKKYNVYTRDLPRTQKICELLKDADALDRFRFAQRGALDPQFLRSSPAKSPEMIQYAENINRNIAKQILTKIYEKGDEEIISGGEVLQLRNIRKEKSHTPLYSEKHLSIRELASSLGLEPKEFSNSKNEKLKQLYKNYDISLSDIKSISDILRSRDQNQNQNQNQNSKEIWEE